MPSPGSINNLEVLSLRCQQCFGPLTWHLWKRSLKWDSLDIYLTMFIGVRKLENTSGMRVIFIWKCSKLNRKSGNARKNWEKDFPFWDICIWTCCKKLPLLRREYLSSTVNGLKKCPKILYIAQRDFFNLNRFHRDQ